MIRIEPSGYTSTVLEIISPSGIVQKAVAGEQVTIRLADDIDISRGDTFVAQHSPITAITYVQNVATGSFILIDEATYHTVSAGMILATE